MKGFKDPLYWYQKQNNNYGIPFCFRRHSQIVHHRDRHTLIKANKGKVWHKSPMYQEIVPRSSMDTDARWEYGPTKDCVFGYKLHLNPVLVPLRFLYFRICNSQYTLTNDYLKLNKFNKCISRIPYHYNELSNHYTYNI